MTKPFRFSVQAASPDRAEGFGVFGLMLTLVRLYRELLRLVAQALGDD